MTREKACCKICLDDSAEHPALGRLGYPCKCRLDPVHEHCLGRWRFVQAQSAAAKAERCEVCGEAFPRCRRLAAAVWLERRAWLAAVPLALLLMALKYVLPVYAALRGAALLAPQWLAAAHSPVPHGEWTAQLALCAALAAQLAFYWHLYRARPVVHQMQINGELPDEDLQQLRAQLFHAVDAFFAALVLLPPLWGLRYSTATAAPFGALFLYVGEHQDATDRCARLVRFLLVRGGTFASPAAAASAVE